MTITTVVVKPKSRGYVRLRSADPADMPLVSPQPAQRPADMRAMIDGQRFFLRAFQTEPARRADRRASPFPTRPISSDEALAHALPALREDQLPPAPAPAAWALPATAWRCSIRGSACAASRGCGSATSRRCPNINAGNTNAPGDDAGQPLRQFILEGEAAWSTGASRLTAGSRPDRPPPARTWAVTWRSLGGRAACPASWSRSRWRRGARAAGSTGRRRRG